MLFNSYEFILFFLPLTFILYFLMQHFNSPKIARAWLVSASLFFYSWWNIKYLPLILISIFVNYGIGSILSSKNIRANKLVILVIGISFNLSLLGYYKYADFFIVNFNNVFASSISLLGIILPLGISFFTFTQIAYLVDAYQGKAKEYSMINYMLFVTFFPHLLAGPILHHKEMMPQFADPDRYKLDFNSIAPGLFLFFIGLGKKVFIADNFAIWANQGFDQMVNLSVAEAWITSLSYSFQLYFDFSAYTDMAIGAALLFNIVLPINFYSPYKSQSIQEFWRCWHMTLGRFFRDYLYIAWGGNRQGELRTCCNLLATFLLVGLWHGAGWTFVFWGLLHGMALVIHRLWSKLGIKLNRFLGWFITFNFVNIAWVFFRAKNWQDAHKVLSGMFGVNGWAWSGQLQSSAYFTQKLGIFGISDTLSQNIQLILAISMGLIICLFCKNSIEYWQEFRPNIQTALVTMSLAIAGILSLTKVTQFLYFNF